MAVLLQSDLISLEVLKGFTFSRQQCPRALFHFPIFFQNYSGTTALHIASSLGNCEIAAKLVRYGADTTLKNSNFDTPLSLAKNDEVSYLEEY